MILYKKKVIDYEKAVFHLSDFCQDFENYSLWLEKWNWGFWVGWLIVFIPHVSFILEQVSPQG